MASASAMPAGQLGGSCQLGGELHQSLQAAGETGPEPADFKVCINN